MRNGSCYGLNCCLKVLLEQVEVGVTKRRQKVLEFSVAAKNWHFIKIIFNYLQNIFANQIYITIKFHLLIYPLCSLFFIWKNVFFLQIFLIWSPNSKKRRLVQIFWCLPGSRFWLLSLHPRRV